MSVENEKVMSVEDEAEHMADIIKEIICIVTGDCDDLISEIIDILTKNRGL